MITDPQSHEPLEAMLRLLNGHSVEQALHVVAVLGVADLLRDGARSSDDLARATGTDQQALHRLLRLLTTVDVFREDGNGNFVLTPLASTLRSDLNGPMRDRAIYCGRSEMWQVWGNLMHTVKTGASAFEHVHVDSFYQFLAKRPEVGAPFNGYMTKTSEQHVAALLEAYDFSQFRTLVDVGGGHASTLAAILQACPQLHGTLFDLPQVVEGARALQAPGIAERSRRVGGDMHQSVPSGSNGYLIKWILMDRSDEAAVNVLRNCREAMADSAKVIVVETLLPRSNPSHVASLFDMQMMLLFGRGRLRSEQEHRDLFEAAGLTLARCIPTRSPNTILEGVRPHVGTATGSQNL